MLGRRTLFDWEETPPQRPTAPDGTALWHQQNDDVIAARWTDSLCQAVSELPVVRGMLETNPKLAGLWFSFIDDPEAGFAKYNLRTGETMLNAAKVKDYYSGGDEEKFKLQVTCIFLMLHEMRHAHQYSYPMADPHMKTIRKENPQLISTYDSLVREADANAFALTGIYDLHEHHTLMPNYDEDQLQQAVAAMPIAASRAAFLKSISEDKENFTNGIAQQKAFAAYFKEDPRLLSMYIEEAISLSEQSGMDYNQGGRITAAFKSAAGQDVFFNTYSFLRGMPSVMRDPESTLIERYEYLRQWPLKVRDFTSAITPDQFVKMGFRPSVY